MSFSAFILSFGLLLGALLLSVTAAQALAAVLRRVRWPAAFSAKIIALFPLAAWIWMAMGFSVGHLGLPVGSLSLMTGDQATDTATRIAQIIWWWAPPVFLLALPLTAELLFACLVGKRPLFSQIRLVGWLAIALQAIVEDAFHLPGALASLVPSLHSANPSLIAGALVAPAFMAVVWWTIMGIWPRKSQPYQPTREDLIRDGALAIGLSPEEAWKQHLLPGQIRRGLAAAFSLAAWAISLWASLGCPGQPELGKAWHQALNRALGDPLAPLYTAWPYALCALCFWLTGRIVVPRNR